MKRRLRVPPLPRVTRLVVAVVVGVGVWWVGAPRLLGRLEFFRVRQVELVGLEHLSPDAVIGALRLGPAASVFTDDRLLADRVKGLLGVADARVVRRGSSTLQVTVREVTPVALVPGPPSGRLAVVDASGRPLPFDPARAGLDLPIAQTADSAVVGVLAVVQAVDPALFQAVTTARPYGHGDVLLEVRDGEGRARNARRVLLARHAGPEVIRAVVLVAQDLAARARPYAELDARYAGQVIVRRGRGGSA
ncbi:MAG: cell division protein FtsQ/DivIB [Gemmatimonadales bacterium]